MKYSDEPDKFMDSEVELDDVVKRMMIIAGSPELYPDLARTQVGCCRLAVPYCKSFLPPSCYSETSSLPFR